MNEQFADRRGATPSRPDGIAWFTPGRPRERWRPTPTEVRDVAVAAVFLLAGVALAFMW